MPQIQKGTTFSTGQQVTAELLNQLVDNAFLTPEAISLQLEADTVSLTDQVLLLKNSALYRATVNQIIGNSDLAPFVKKDGTVAMTGQLTLANSAPTTNLAATSKGYVDTTVTTAVNAAVTTASVPTGAIMAFYRSTAPTGWMECNGAAISNSGTTAALYALIGETLPDLRGEFIRGLDNGRIPAVDQPRTLGSSQAQDVQPHVHYYGSTNGYGGFTGYGTIGAGGSFATSSVGTKETRPRNVAFLYCIKL